MIWVYHVIRKYMSDMEPVDFNRFKSYNSFTSHIFWDSSLAKKNVHFKLLLWQKILINTYPHSDICNLT